MKIDTSEMRRAAGEAGEMLRLLANRHRLLIVCELVGGERSVGQLAQALGLRDANVSQHLAQLRRSALVDTRREGQTIWYSLASVPASRVIAVLQDVYCRPLGPRPRLPQPPVAQMHLQPEGKRA